MAKKIGISAGMLNNISKSVKKIDEIDMKANYKIEYIALKDLVPNPKNFYELVNIEELAEDIKLNGLNSNLLVRPIGDEGKYELIGGHRRYSALSKLVSEGEKKFKIVPCQVRKLNDIDTEMEEKYLTEYINEFLKSLPREKRIIIVQRYWYLYSIKDIAEKNNLSQSNVKMTLSRFRTKLKEFLEERGQYI